MRLPLILALLALSALPSSADEIASLPKGLAQESRPPGPAPQLLHLERTLMQKQEARDKGELPPEKYQEFAIQFRAELDAVMGRITPTPEDRGLHGQILARLGDKERDLALASLNQALLHDPQSPALLVAKGGILYELRDFAAADALALRAWEAGGRKDERAWALHKMSEGRISSAPSGEPVPRLKPASDFARLDWSIPQRHDIRPQAVDFIKQATEARRRFDFEATARHSQAAMNADPTSLTVQTFYGLAQADVAKHRDADAYIEQAISAVKARRIEDAVAWAQRAYDRNPTDDTYGVLEKIGRTKAQAEAIRATEPPKAPTSKKGLPPWALFAAGMTGALLLSWGAASQETRDHFKRVLWEQPRQEAKVLAAAGVVAGAFYAAPIVWRAVGPATGALRAGQESVRRLVSSEVGAINPRSVSVAQNVTKSGVWSPGKFSDPTKNALEHWNNHRLEFPELRNSKEYVEAAWRFVRNPPQGTLVRERLATGERVFYHPGSNTLVVRAADGVPKTMFRPSTTQHPYPTNLDYFNAQ